MEGFFELALGLALLLEQRASALKNLLGVFKGDLGLGCGRLGFGLFDL